MAEHGGWCSFHVHSMFGEFCPCFVVWVWVLSGSSSTFLDGEWLWDKHLRLLHVLSEVPSLRALFLALELETSEVNMELG